MTATTHPAQPRRVDARTERLRALAQEAQERFADGGAEDTDGVLAWAAAHFRGRVAVACSMQDTVLPHVVAEHLPGVDVLFLDTGYHFPETVATRDRVADLLDVTVVDVRPELTVAAQDARLGKDLFARDPGACCRLRKVEPLRRALAGYDAWVTGVRREEGPTRADTPLVTWDEAFGLVKVNPLAAWTSEQVRAHAERHLLPANPLLAQGYPSIGCAPCTRPVVDGDDPRAGRWAGFAKTECGLHPGTAAATTTEETS
ncbi:phosphoadenylyl-sulfate reductase [Ornithinimicrobium pekingense]|uniref:Adenosine 5'-phosphosulfate reductase n=1 Tax=Ornithinimicrobium pekingense TaxID=384677 RepID=A0ABQ2F6Y0_9MICO|nr:phosphoadenylyl-sulfate reductase [Ornithinimicrobium pekingense]GGK58173.1 phosphoadenosine phosphosulfate reductase [Ornithinimicrobium pekingense]